MERAKIHSLADAARAAINGLAAGVTSRDEAVAMIAGYRGRDRIDLGAITGPQALPIELLDVLHERCGLEIELRDGKMTGVTYRPPVQAKEVRYGEA